ncbi:unnamed protein product [Closterium sp. Naga37s-1]|nr:unnamed protein product [Closterium sp. Naga37s-1]
MASKKRRMTQQVLQWGTPPPRPVAPPPRPAPPPIRPLSDEEKKEKAYLKAQKSYTSDWLPKFDWLILDRTPEGDPEALAVKDTAGDEQFKDFSMVDKAIRAVGEIVGRSTPWYERFKELQLVIHSTNLEHQGLFDVRWLSRADAVNRLVKILGSAIVLFLEYKHKIAAVVKTLTFHFCLYFLADLLGELNSLNRFFQRRRVEVTQVTEEVDRVVSLIEHRYIDYEGSFGAGLSTHLSPFMARVKKGDKKVKVEGVDASGRPVKHTIELSELPVKNHKFRGTLADCVKMGKAFAREVVYNLKHRMRDLRRMGGMKLFRVDKWPSNPDTHVVDIWRKQKKRRPTKSPAPFHPANDKGKPEAISDDERESDVADDE